MATVWNFAIHGVCYGPDNLMFSGDIMGKACEEIEEQIGGVALFINADAGDIDPGMKLYYFQIHFSISYKRNIKELIEIK